MRIRGRHLRLRPSDDYGLLAIRLPKVHGADRISPENLLNDLHDLILSKKVSRLSGALTAHISLEIAAVDGQLSFFIWLPKNLQVAITRSILKHYPNAQVREQASDYAHRPRRDKVSLSAELTPEVNKRPSPTEEANFRTDLAEVIKASLSKIDPQQEEIWIQILIRPQRGSWKESSLKAVNRVRRRQKSASKNLASKLNYASRFFGALARSKRAGGPADMAPGITSEYPLSQPNYRVKIRLFYSGRDQRTARLRLQALAGIFHGYSAPKIIRFKLRDLSFNPDKQLEYYARFFIDKGFLLNSRQLATFFELTYAVEQATLAKSAGAIEAPVAIATADEPAQLVSLFGLAAIDEAKVVFGIRRQDRPRHLLILGEAGTGKSHLLELMMLSDIFYNQGFALIDGHGDLAEKIISFIPKRRYDDVVYLNLSDVRRPVGFNPLEDDNPALRGQLEVDLVSSMKKLFADEWGPSTEYLLRQVFLALMDYPEATLLDISHLLTQADFRREVIAHLKDKDVKSFWQDDFEDWQNRYPEVIITMLNKIGDFLASPAIKNVVGQSTTAFAIRKLMDDGKILIVNLDQRLLGEANAATFGELVFAKLRLAAASRLSGQSEQAKPFYVYIDDFENFVTDSFTIAITEAKRLGINLTLADRSLTELSNGIKTKLLEHIGSKIFFRLSDEDAEAVQNLLKPHFSTGDLTEQHHGSFVASLIVNDEKLPAFGGQLLNLPMPPTDNRLDIIAVSRANWSVDSRSVDKQLNKYTSPAGGTKALSDIFRLATKGLARANVGKLATGSLKSAAKPGSTQKVRKDDSEDEQVIKLH